MEKSNKDYFACCLIHIQHHEKVSNARLSRILKCPQIDIRLIYFRKRF